MLQLFGLFYVSFIFIVSCLFARLIYNKFSNYPIRLISIYTIFILMGLSWYGINYWQLTQLNSLSIPFSSSSGSTGSFNFTPNNSGYYSVDLTFLNNKFNKEYEACAFPWEKSIATVCKKALIFRTISGTINNKKFSNNAQYQNWEPGSLEYGYNNHSIVGPSLNISKLRGKKNLPIQMEIKIDANASEIQTTKPIIVVGSDEESFISLRRTRDDFGIIVIPFLLSMIILTFKAIKNKRN